MPTGLINLLNAAFRLLYHQFAFTYDLVAFLVSSGKWKTWVFQAVNFIYGENILELGYGPGHLQALLHKRGLHPFGLDESRQMSRIAYKRLRKSLKTSNGYAKSSIRLLRGVSQAVPFATHSFDTVISTFPSPYIFDWKTLAEIDRVLKPGGTLAILFSAVITGKSLADRISRWLFFITAETTPTSVNTELLNRLKYAGFDAHTQWVYLPTSQVLFFIGKKGNHL